MFEDDSSASDDAGNESAGLNAGPGSPRSSAQADEKSIDQAEANDALQRTRNGDGTGFEYLFNELAGPLSAYARRQGADDPDGVANRALFDAYKGLPNFDGDFGAFRGYVYRIARNRMIDDHRRSERRPKVTELTARDVVPVTDEVADRMGSNEWVTNLLEQLTEDQREVITLRVLGDLSIQDTARIMDKPVTAIKALQRRAVRRLHSLTGEEVHT